MRSDLLKNAEYHNIIRVGNRLRTRKGLVSVLTPPANTQYIAGFSVENAEGEVYHYLFEYNIITKRLTVKMYSEEFTEIYDYLVGKITPDAVITMATHNRQLMFNSPQLSYPLYGLVGGGLIKAIKTEADDPDRTALNIPNGHICSFGDRFVIAQDSILYFNDAGTDPRTFVAQNAIAVDGIIHDLFQATDGSLQVFTSNGVYYLAQDALGKGQSVLGFIGKIPGIQSIRPQTAASSLGVSAVLQEEGLLVLSDGNQLLNLSPYEGGRYLSENVEQANLALNARIFPYANGFYVGFNNRRGYLLDFNLKNGYRSYVTHKTSNLYLVGVLKGAEGEPIMLFRDRVCLWSGNSDFSSQDIEGIVCKSEPIPEGISAIARRFNVASNNVGQNTSIYFSGRVSSTSVATIPNDIVVGTNNWGTGSYRTRSMRSTQHSFGDRVTDINFELKFVGGNRDISSGVDIELDNVVQRANKRDF